jgi:hypothetical protein
VISCKYEPNQYSVVNTPLPVSIVTSIIEISEHHDLNVLVPLNNITFVPFTEFLK